MALIKCPECGQEISDTCEACIHCGFRLAKPKRKRGPQIIAKRGYSGGVTALAAIFTVIGALIVSTFVVCLATGLRDTYFELRVLRFFGLLIGLAFLLPGTWLLVKVARANRLTDDCVIYDPDTDTVEMTALGDRKIVIKPDMIIEVRANFFSDFLLEVKYTDENHRIRKANLGFTLSREAAVTNIRSLMSGAWQKPAD